VLVAPRVKQVQIGSRKQPMTAKIQINRAPVLTLWAAGVERYLERKFGDALTEARKAMANLARSFEPDELAERGFSLYEQFRPKIPEGVSGWGSKGELDLGGLRKLAVQK